MQKFAHNTSVLHHHTIIPSFNSFNYYLIYFHSYFPYLFFQCCPLTCIAFIPTAYNGIFKGPLSIRISPILCILKFNYSGIIRYVNMYHHAFFQRPDSSAWYSRYPTWPLYGTGIRKSGNERYICIFYIFFILHTWEMQSRRPLSIVGSQEGHSIVFFICVVLMDTKSCIGNSTTHLFPIQANFHLAN